MSDSENELDIDSQGLGHPLFDVEENGGNLSTASDSIPSPPDNRSRDPSYSSSINVSLAVPRRHTRADGNISPDTSIVEGQHPIRRVNTSTALSVDGIETASTSSRVNVDEVLHTAAATSVAGSQTTGDSKLSHSASKSKKPFKMDDELKNALLDIAKSFKQVGKTSKQNSLSFLGDLPYYGVPEDSDPKKNIIPISAPNRFLDIIEAVCDKEEFTDVS